MKTLYQKLILGLDIGGTKTAVVLGSLRGEIRWRQPFPTRPERGFEAVFDELIAAIEKAFAAPAILLERSVTSVSPRTARFVTAKPDRLRDTAAAPASPGWRIK